MPSTWGPWPEALSVSDSALGPSAPAEMGIQRWSLRAVLALP